MNYKKPAFWIVIAAVLVCAAVAVCFLTDPIDETDEMDPGVIAELEQYRTEWIGDAPKVSHIAQLLPYPKDYHYSSLELQTREEPYELIVYLNGTDPVQQEDFENCAAIAFDLIGNIGILSFRDAESEATIASFARTDEDEHDLKSMGNSSPANPSAANPDPSMLLTQRSAEETITQILATLTVHSDETVSLTLPQTIPVSEDGKTKLTISINAAFSDAPGSYTVQKLLEEETGWQGGESPRISLDTERGELVSVTLNVFYMTELDASTRSIYAQGNVDASAPFSYDVPLGYTTPSVQIEQMGQAATLHYTLPDGSTPVLSLRLPQNMAAVAGEDLQILLTQTGEAVGSVNLYPFGATDEQALQQIDSAVNALPMQIFSTIALSNHAGYDGYQVRQYSSTGAVATAKFIWQDLSSGSAAASIPWQEQDCVLVYDWGVMPYFVEIKLAQGLCSERELTEVAESIKLE